MKKIRSIYFCYLRNEAHYEFLWTYLNLVDAFSNVKALVAALYNTFASLLATEKKLLDAPRASALTEKIAEADSRIDRAISAIIATIQAARYSLDQAIAEAARLLQIRLREFGDIRTKAYEEESAAIQVLLTDLTTTLYPKVQLIAGLVNWVSELSAAETTYTQLYVQRNTEISQRPKERMIDVRRQIEATYNGMTTIIDASAITNTTGAYDTFIAQLNAQIDYFNEHNHRHARKDIGVGDSCYVEEIASQPYTGKAITPLPKEVYYHEAGKPAVELVFTQDYSLTYKNNVEPGTADLILHGKGAYRGQKTVTFTISRSD